MGGRGGVHEWARGRVLEGRSWGLPALACSPDKRRDQRATVRPQGGYSLLALDAIGFTPG